MGSYGQPTSEQHLTVSRIVLLCVETPLHITPSSTALDIASTPGRKDCAHLSDYPNWNYVRGSMKKMGKLLKCKCWFMTASHDFESLLCMANLLKKKTNNWKTPWLGALALKFFVSVLTLVVWIGVSLQSCIISMHYIQITTTAANAWLYTREPHAI